MTRMTKSLSLVLIGSALILAGCSAPLPPQTKEGCKDDPEKEKDGQRPPGCTGTTTRHHHHYRSGGRGVFVTPMTPRTTSGFHAPSVSRPSAPATPSSRAGGFGSTGRGAVS
jgi:hypothetical protein